MNNLRGNGISRMSFLFTKFHVVSCDTVTVCVTVYEYRVHVTASGQLLLTTVETLSSFLNTKLKNVTTPADIKLNQFFV